MRMLGAKPMTAKFDVSTLNWVKGEIDASLDQARLALESFVNTPDDETQMRFCVMHLHQVRGTLQMVELYGAAQVADEMERLGLALQEQRIPDVERGSEILMRAILQLPDYLEGLQAGQTDSALVLLPLINELRRLRGEQPLPESTYFKPDLTVAAPAAEPAVSGVDVSALAQKARPYYQSCLLHLLRGEDATQSFRALRALSDKLLAAAAEPQVRQWFWIFGGFVDSLAETPQALRTAAKKLLSRGEQVLKLLGEGGEAALAQQQLASVLTSLLFQVAQAHDGERIAELKQAFSLDTLLAAGTPRAAGLSGFNAELKKTLAGDILEELATVQDALDIFVRSEQRAVANLVPMAETLERLASTLRMMAQDSLAQTLLDQVVVIRDLQVSGQTPDDSVLMGIASAVLAVDSALRDWGSIRPLEQADALAEQVEGLSPEAEAEHHRVIRQVMKEAKSNLLKVKDAVDAFLEAFGDPAPLQDTAPLLREIIGSLNLLSYKRVAQVLRACSMYINHDLAQAQSAPDTEYLDALADALTSVEYYLDAFVESRVHPAMVLEVAEKAVAKLGYPVDALPPPEEPAAIEIAAPVPAVAEPAAAPVVEEQEAPPAAALASASAPPDEELDEEIRDIFIEEASEEIAKIGELLPQWQANRADEESLRDLRRCFHTLKGSGRLVGANVIGEFAWAFENMLNRVIDNTIEPGNAMFDLLDQAREALSELVEQFRNGAAVDADIEWFSAAAEAMSKPGGLEAMMAQQAAPAVAAPEPVIEQAVPAAPQEAGEPEPELDPVLLEIYGNETEGHLAAIDEFVTGCRTQGACRVSESLTRALHTLQGSSRMAGVIPVADISSHLEKYAKALHTAHEAVGEEGLAALEECVGFARDQLAFLQGGRAAAPLHQELLAKAEELHHATHHLAEGLEAAPEAGLAVAPSLEAVPTSDVAAEEIVVEAPSEGAAEPLESAPEPTSAGVTAEEVSEEAAASATEAEPSLEDILSSIEVEEITAAPVADEPLPIAFEAPASIPEPERPPVPADFDHELLEIFLEEGAEILDACEETLQAWREQPDDRSLVEALQRQLHTLKGSARMAGITAIGDLSHTLESIFEDVVEGRLARSRAMIDLLQLAQDRLVEMLEQVRNNAPLSNADDLINRIHALARGTNEIEETEPLEAAAAPSYDANLAAAFMRQAEEILESCDARLQSWALHDDKLPIVRELEGELHALGTAAATAAVTGMADVGFAVALLLGSVTEGRLPATNHLLGVLQRTYDRLTQMLDELRQGTLPAPAADLIAAVEEMAAEVPEATAAPLAEPLSRAEEEALAKGERRQSFRAAQELVRVRSELLDNLVNFAGEVSIYRSRVEQQVGGFNYSLRDFGEILARLGEQLRQFTIDTEAQIQSRYEDAVHEGYEDFDPLEFDRFTHMQQLARSTMESLSDLVEVRDTMQGATRETETLLLQQARVNTELQEGLMHTRMVPLVENAPRLRRIVRQTCAELSKEVELRFQGGEVEMDRHMVERMLAPIEHLLRNAIAHGIETPEARRGQGKPASGQITIAQAREGSEVVIRIIDDGQGVNLDRVRHKAVERGLMKADAGLSDKEVMHFILESGFSTAESLTQLSGRGVGMDVVNSEIKQLGGLLEIDTKPGQGTTFTVRLPLTLSVTRALLVQSGEQIYAVPLVSIQGIERIDRGRLEQMLAVENPTYSWLNQDYLLLSLGGLLGAGGIAVADEIVKRPLLFTQSGDHYVAWAADNLLGSREIVVKSLGPQLSTLRGLSGATILGDGRVALILDLPMLARLGLAHRSVAEEEAIAAEVQRVEQPVVMVVDDSITVRKVTSRLLERNDLRPVTAKDGVDAIAQLEDVIPDVMLLDIEMPRMDGYELATHMRNTARLKHIPIIMITSRSGEKHRQRALEIGVDRYMSKPYQETELLENIRTLLAERAKR